MSLPAPLVVSLSAIPPRFPHLGPTLRSILRQTARIDEVQLWIPRAFRRFPDWDGRLPEVPEGVTIRRCDDDLGPATKVLPALRLLAGYEVDVLYCDDDMVLDPGWAARFRDGRARHPACAIAECGWDVADIPLAARPADRLPRHRRTRRDLRYRLERVVRLGLSKPPRFRTSGYADVANGFAGVMVRPSFLSEAAFRIPDALWMVDDPWLSGQLALGGVGIWLNAGQHLPWAGSGRLVDALLHAEFEGAGRTASNRACVEWFQRHHGIWLPPRGPDPETETGPRRA